LFRALLRHLAVRYGDLFERCGSRASSSFRQTFHGCLISLKRVEHIFFLRAPSQMLYPNAAVGRSYEVRSFQGLDRRVP
jgi:hypothetical protein